MTHMAEEGKQDSASALGRLLRGMAASLCMSSCDVLAAECLAQGQGVNTHTSWVMRETTSWDVVSLWMMSNISKQLFRERWAAGRQKQQAPQLIWPTRGTKKAHRGAHIPAPSPSSVPHPHPVTHTLTPPTLTPTAIPPPPPHAHTHPPVCAVTHKNSTSPAANSSCHCSWFVGALKGHAQSGQSAPSGSRRPSSASVNVTVVLSAASFLKAIVCKAGLESDMDLI